MSLIEREARAKPHMVHHPVWATVMDPVHFHPAAVKNKRRLDDAVELVHGAGDIVLVKGLPKRGVPKAVQPRRVAVPSRPPGGHGNG